MGLFDIFKGKKKEEKVIEVYSPLNGKVISLEEVPDEAFSQKMVGDGCAIEPKEGAIYSPLDAEIDIFETNHAVSIETSEGLEMIIHFGVDTVKLKGEGLIRIANPGEVKKGEKLIEYDLEFLKNNAKSVKTPVIVNSMDMVERIEIEAKGEVKAGDLLMKVYLK